MSMRQKQRSFSCETMEIRSCSNLHFVNAIRGNLVTKLCNVDSCGKPALTFRTLKDIIKHEDVKKLQPSTKHSLQCSELEFSFDRVKIESLCLPLVDRTLREIDPEGDESTRPFADDETGSDSDDYNFGKMTLKQLKEKCKTKKRKRSNSTGLNLKEGEIKLDQEGDESDLKKPLSSLKLKLPKAKRKSIRAGSKSPKVGISIKYENNLESGMQSPSNLLSLVHVKPEIPDPEFIECERRFPFLDDSPNNNYNDEPSAAKSISDRNLEMVKCQNRKWILFPEEYGSCTINEFSYDQLENVEPISLLLPICEDTVEENNEDKSCQQFLEFPFSESETEEHIEQPRHTNIPTENHGLDVNDCSTSFRHTNEFQSIEMQIRDLVVDEDSSSKDLYHVSNTCLIQNDATENLASNQQVREITSPARISNLSWNPDPCPNNDDNNDFLSLKDGLTEQKQTSICCSSNVPNNCLNTGDHLGSMDDESTLNEEELCPMPIDIGEGRNSSSEYGNCNTNEMPSASLLGQPPERLLSTRKVISPTSQERLCLSMNSTKLYNDHNYKGKIYLGKRTENNVSSLGSDIKHANDTEYPNGSGMVNQGKVTTSPTRILQKPKNDRRSLHKGNLDGPRLSRSLPTVGSGCTSLQGCSESAISFSQRQMHDIESLAMKLMSELKSMKDIVEEKFLFEAYRNVSLKNDADEVKSLVTNAKKVEETARKWLSMMARDCNRFCKIMSLTQKSTTGAASSIGVQRERKKISFADEAGGALCQVKFFEDGMISRESITINQEDQSI